MEIVIGTIVTAVAALCVGYYMIYCSVYGEKEKDLGDGVDWEEYV
jgi:hypothetical protein